MKPANRSPEKTQKSLLINALDSADMCGVGKSQWYALVAAGKAPAPIKLGRKSLWRKDELKEWIGAGCPVRKIWENMLRKKRDID